MNKEKNGFTIIELLITAALGTVIMGTIVSVLVGQTREGLVIERTQRAREDMNRIALFIDGEVGEGDLVTPSASLSQCANTGTSVFTIRIPYWSTNTRTSTTSQYYVDSSGSLRRCGPPILSDGKLNPAGTRIDSVISTNTSLTQTNAAASRSVGYTISVNDGTGNTIGTRSSKARTRTGLIDN